MAASIETQKEQQRLCERCKEDCMSGDSQATEGGAVTRERWKEWQLANDERRSSDSQATEGGVVTLE